MGDNPVPGLFKHKLSLENFSTFFISVFDVIDFLTLDRFFNSEGVIFFSSLPKAMIFFLYLLQDLIDWVLN